MTDVIESLDELIELCDEINEQNEKALNPKKGVNP